MSPSVRQRMAVLIGGLFLSVFSLLRLTHGYGGRGVANVFERLLADLLPSSVWIDLDREKSVANQPLGPLALKERSSDSSEGGSVRLFIKGAHEFKVSC
jgi:hypothetical protein